MKLRQSFLSFLLLLAVLQVCFSQEKPQAVLLDRIEGIASCEDLRARIEVFLRIKPNSIGYIVINGKKNDFNRNLAAEKIIRAWLEIINFDERRLIIKRGKEKDALLIELWEIPSGAEKPVFEKGKWSLTLSKNRRPFIFNSTKDDSDTCPIRNQLKIYSEYLTANPNIRGRIVIFSASKNHFQMEKNKLSNQLSNKYNISPTQLEFMLVKKKLDYSYTEFWLVPQKNK